VHSVAVGTCDIKVSGSSINKHLFGAVRNRNGSFPFSQATA